MDNHGYNCSNHGSKLHKPVYRLDKEIGHSLRGLRPLSKVHHKNIIVFYRLWESRFLPDCPNYFACMVYGSFGEVTFTNYFKTV